MTNPAWPSLSSRPITWSWQLVANAQIWTSPLDGSSQASELPGARWNFRFGYQNLREDDLRVLDAFLASLRGMAGKVLISPIQAESRRGVGTGAPVVSGSGQLGRTLNTAGWTPSTPLILRAGDYFSIDTAAGPELKILTADAASDADGKASLTFEPPLRMSPVTGSALTITSPVAVMSPLDNAQAELALNGVRRYGAWTGQFVERWA